MERSAFRPALEGLEHVRSEDGKILTKPFLDVCKTILPVLGMSYNVDAFYLKLMSILMER